MVGTNSADKVLGATDPTSGTASVHEVVKGLGALVKSGWKPLRTILIASWDAEEVSAFSQITTQHPDPSSRSTVLLAALNGAKTSKSSSTSTLSPTSISVSFQLLRSSTVQRCVLTP